ncbi:MAG TPA: PilZ domain-containing protein [Vicinamibacteria bacterium]|nr:PilZ domain-containing protein [Vicinamibacteria bacterium]
MNGELARGQARAQVPVRFLDLSLGGALLVMPAALEKGGIYDFALDLEGDRIWVQAEVRHVHPADRGAGYHVGVQFVGIDPQDEKLLREYVEGHAR